MKSRLTQKAKAQFEADTEAWHKKADDKRIRVEERTQALFEPLRKTYLESKKYDIEREASQRAYSLERIYKPDQYGFHNVKWAIEQLEKSREEEVARNHFLNELRHIILVTEYSKEPSIGSAPVLDDYRTKQEVVA